MKHTLMIGVAAVMFATSCSSGSSENQAETREAEEVVNAEDRELVLNVDTEQSQMLWVGSKKLGSSHNGQVQISEGSLGISGGMITDGSFVVDMTTITNEDLPEEGDYNQAKLVGHLMSGDFFDVENHPTARFEITQVNAMPDDQGNTHNISGNLTLRGVTKNITFPAAVEITESGVTANASFSINRLDWGVNFDRDAVEGIMDKIEKKMKDDFVRNSIDLQIKLVAN